MAQNGLKWPRQVSRDPVERLKFTYLQAASSTAATTFTTAMSFFANLASVLRPLREFGFFMGVCAARSLLSTPRFTYFEPFDGHLRAFQGHVQALSEPFSALQSPF